MSAFTVNLNCGCENRFIVYVYNFWRSPLGVIYHVRQSTRGCYDCPNSITNYYNRKTCKCECMNKNTDCPCKQPKEWSDYPSCGCVCPPKTCSWRQYYDLRTCRCTCKDICCPKGFAMHKSLCICMATNFAVASDLALPSGSLVQEEDCVPMACPPPTSWKQSECKCI